MTTYLPGVSTTPVQTDACAGFPELATAFTARNGGGGGGVRVSPLPCVGVAIQRNPGMATSAPHGSYVRELFYLTFPRPTWNSPPPFARNTEIPASRYRCPLFRRPVSYRMRWRTGIPKKGEIIRSIIRQAGRKYKDRWDINSNIQTYITF